MITIYTRYFTPSDDGIDFGVDFEEDSLTQQQFAAESDINNILAKYERTGVIPVSQGREIYGDFGNIDYQEAMNDIINAQDYFDSLPARVRSEFDNDLSKFLSSLDDDDFRQRGVELGLFESFPAADVPAVDVPAADVPAADVTK